MMKPASKPYMNPYIAGVFLGLVLTGSYLILGAGLGASSGIARIAAAVMSWLLPAHTESSLYFGAWGKNPLAYYLVYMFAGTIIGGLISSSVSGRFGFQLEKGRQSPAWKRICFALAGGIMVGYASRLAGVFYFRDMAVIKVMFTAMITAIICLQLSFRFGLISEQALLAGVDEALDHMEPEDLASRISSGHKDILLVDIRPRAEFLHFHIKTARNIELKELFETLSPYKNKGIIVLYSNGMTHPAQARDALSRAGFQNVYLLTDGLEGFIERCLKPVSLRSEPIPESHAVQINQWRSFFLGYEQILWYDGGWTQWAALPELPVKTGEAP